jgi:hypothetical protein
MFRKFMLMSAIAGIVAVTIPNAANAQRRVGNAAMGAAAGMMVGGPIGAIAGGAIGYTSGEHIARGMGIRHRHFRYRYTQDGRRYRTYY